MILMLLAILVDAQSQDLSRTDSLKQLLSISNLERNWRLEYLLEVAVFSPDPADKENFARRLLDEIGPEDSAKYWIDGYHALGVASRMNGDLQAALSHLFGSAKQASVAGELELLGDAYVEIATTYRLNEEYQKALLYQNRAVDIYRQQGSSQRLALNLLNTGYAYYSLEKYDSALLCYNEAEPILNQINLTIGQAYVMGNRALVFWKIGRTRQAEEDLLQAIEMLQPLGDQYGMADYHNQLGNLYRERGLTEKATFHLQKGLTMALDLDLKEQIRDASLTLSGLYADNDQYAEAYAHHRQYLGYRDSIQNDATTRQMADLRTAYEVDLREKEIGILQRDKQLQWIYILVAITLLALFIVLFLLYRQRLITQKLESVAVQKGHEEEVQNLLEVQEKKAFESMIVGRENERKRLAGELHNHLGSLLATVKMNLNGVEQQDHRILTLHQLVDQAYSDVRELSHALNMGVSDDFGLTPALNELIGHLSATGNLKIEFQSAMEGIKLDLAWEVVIYRMIQELVSNILKHAGATHMSLLLTYFEDDELLNIMVTDNGRGFEPAPNPASGGIGLSGIQTMVESLDGELEIDSQPSQGTTISIDLPIEPLETEFAP